MAILSPAYKAALIATRDPLYLETAEGRTTDKPCKGDICTPADFYDWADITEDWTNIAYAVVGGDSRKLFPVALKVFQEQAIGNTNWSGMIDSAIEISREASKAAYQVAHGQTYQPPAAWLAEIDVVPVPSQEEALKKAQQELQDTLEKLQEDKPPKKPPPKSGSSGGGLLLAGVAVVGLFLLLKKGR